VRNAFGTVRYASPEMANDVCGQKADIWSAGVVMYILLCGKAPFLKSNDVDTLNLIKSGPKVRFNGDRWTAISQAAKDCIRALLEPNPRARPTAVEVLAMPWLKQQ
ncbi:Calcium-dependent protein kinase 34, partial [Tetrabaena socialis]